MSRETCYRCWQAIRNAIFLMLALWYLALAAWTFYSKDVPHPELVAGLTYLLASWIFLKEVNV